jgi:hypothetical protein
MVRAVGRPGPRDTIAGHGAGIDLRDHRVDRAGIMAPMKWLSAEGVPGLASDAALLGPESRVEVFEDHALVRTPARRDFWCGNALWLRQAPASAEAALALWRRHFDPEEIERIVIQWEVAAGNAASALVAGAESIDVLVDGFDGAPAAGRAGRCVEVADPALFERIVDATLASQAAGDNGNRDERYTRWQYAEYWARRCAGRLRWFAALDGDDLCSACGVVVHRGVARHVDVLTVLGRRRQGWADAVVRHAARAVRGEAQRLVIAAEPDSSAGRLYRRIGFELATRQWSLSLPPEAH